MPNIFVFGSNRQGRHGAGAAFTAAQYHGAQYGHSTGRQGMSYAIVTKELRHNYPKVTIKEIQTGVNQFIEYATSKPELTFNVTRIGCGLAGFKEHEIAPLFHNSPTNVNLPPGWRNQ